MSLCSIFSFHSFIPYLPCSLKSSEASFIFFHHLLLSHQALISPIFLISPHLSSSHLPAKPKPKPSPSPAPVPAVAVAVAAPCSLKLWSLLFFFHHLKLSSLCVAIASPRLSSSPSQPTPIVVAVTSPLQVSALSSFLVNFLIVVLAKFFWIWCYFVAKIGVVPMLFWAKLKKHLYWNRIAFFFFFGVYMIFNLTLCEFFAVFAGYNIWMEECIENFLFARTCAKSKMVAVAVVAAVVVAVTGGCGNSGGGYRWLWLLFIVVDILFYCSGYISLLWYLYYFIVLKTKITPLLQHVCR